MVPCAKLEALVSPYMPEGRRGRPAFARKPMLRIHFTQQWFNLSALAMEDAPHDVPLFHIPTTMSPDSFSATSIRLNVLVQTSLRTTNH